MRAATITLVAIPFALSAQSPRVVQLEAQALREYVGTYQAKPDSFIYLQLWSEVTGRNQLVAFHESGEVRALFSLARDEFFAGPGAGLATAIESRVGFRRDSTGRIVSLAWRRDSAAPSIARRVEIERRAEVRFSNGAIQLAGTLISPDKPGRHPAIILVHASGAEDREYMLPLARFLIRRGIAVLGYDKRGVGGSTGDWRSASFADLAGDVVAAFEYLKTRSEVDPQQIGLLGWSQAGWIMPLAADRARDIAFLISVSGAGIPASETTIDQSRNEMRAQGMKPETIDEIVGIMKLQYEFARTGAGWDSYAAARARLAARFGQAPATFPANADDPYWDFIRRLYFYDPRPTLMRLRVPTLALFGELDNNILAAKNAEAWESALRGGGNADFTIRVLPKANHLQLEASTGSNAEIPSLRRFVPGYSATLQEWLAKHVRTP